MGNIVDDMDDMDGIGLESLLADEAAWEAWEELYGAPCGDAPAEEEGVPEMSTGADDDEDPWGILGTGDDAEEE